VIYGLIAANLIAFGLELAAGASAWGPSPQKMLDLGGNFGPLTLHGQWWRLVSSTFLHFGVLHVGLNMVCLWQARIVERVFGHAGVAAIYVAAGLAGGVASLAKGGNTVSAGASGAVFGVYGAFVAFLWLRRASMPEAVWARTVRGMGTFIGINLVYGLSTPGIDMSAHIGGLAAGFGAGALLLVGRAAHAQRIQRAVAIAAAGVAIAAGGLVALRAPVDVTPILTKFERVESTCIDTYNALLERSKAGTITDGELADRIEHDVLVPWRGLRAEVFAVEDPPRRVAPLFDDLRRYAVSRQTAWEALVAALRTPPGQPGRFDAYKRAAATTNEDAGAVKDEIARLGARTK